MEYGRRRYRGCADDIFIVARVFANMLEGDRILHLGSQE